MSSNSSSDNSSTMISFLVACRFALTFVLKSLALYSLPKTGILKDGSTVSGYHLLDEEVLLDEGWLPLEDNPPEYDVETQYLIQDGYEILDYKVTKKYRIGEISEREEPMDLEVEIEELGQVIDILLGGEDNE